MRMDLKALTEYVMKEGTDAEKAEFQSYLDREQKNEEYLSKIKVKQNSVHSPLYLLIAKVMVDGQSFRIIHHNMFGPLFMEEHPIFAEYYGKMDDLQDALTEKMITMTDEREPTMTQAVDLFQEAEMKDYSCDEAMIYAESEFSEIMRMMASIHDSMPSDVASDLDAYMSDIRVILYKLRQRLQRGEK